MRLCAALLFTLLAQTFAGNETCVGHCNSEYDRSGGCGCDTSCKKYNNCCPDYDAICGLTSPPDADSASSPRGRPTNESALLPAEAGSCMGRCENGYDSKRNCQCDSMCKYYKSCCSDFPATCGIITRGDTFVIAEDDDERFEGSIPPPLSREQRPTRSPVSDLGRRPLRGQETTLEMNKPQRVMDTIFQRNPARRTTPDLSAQGRTVTHAPTTTAPNMTTMEPSDPAAEVCSQQPFDAFTQMKNGSVYAFRGRFFYVLDERAVLPGYPKKIIDVWGVAGPIDAAFTRVNCQGKTYMFKGTKYWRFDNGVMEDDYPRDISVGFDNIPDNVDAAFALPAPGHNGKEKVYFFKGNQYYTYEFLHQPSHEECATMSESSSSMLFRQYTGVYYNNYEHYLSELFSDLPQHHSKHHFIERDWKGLRAPLDAAMTGRLFVPAVRSTQRRNDDDQQWGQQQGQQYGQQQGQQYGQQWDQQYRQQRDQQQWGRRRQSRSPFWGSLAEQGMNMGQGFAERGMEMGLRMAERRREMEERFGRAWDRALDRRWDQDWDQDRRRDGFRQNNRGNYDSRRGWESYQAEMPIQSVYIFKGDLYYRVDLKTKRIEPALPPYPRSISKFWLGCPVPTDAEK